jgi:hypothetical protein
MATDKASSNGDTSVGDGRKNIHIDVDGGFHRRIKMMCAYKGVTVKQYALAALEEKLRQDDKDVAAGRTK